MMVNLFNHWCRPLESIAGCGVSHVKRVQDGPLLVGNGVIIPI